MNEALCSILCNEPEWSFDTDGRSLKFDEDGTGEVWPTMSAACIML